MIITGISNGTEVFVKASVRTLDTGCKRISVYPCYKNTGEGTIISGSWHIDNPMPGDWYEISSITVFRNTDEWFAEADVKLLLFYNYDSIEAAAGKRVEVKDAVGFNITTVFGSDYISADGVASIISEKPWSNIYDLMIPKVLLSKIDSIRRMTTSAQNVMSYGAVGDGITDDTSAIQSALNSNQAIYFPPGKYLCGALNAMNCPRIYGSGDSSILKSKGDMTLLTIKRDGFAIDDLAVEGSNNVLFTNELGIAITEPLNQIRISRVTLRDFRGNSALYTSNCNSWYNTAFISDCMFLNNNKGFYSDIRGEYITLTGCNFNENIVAAHIKGGNIHIVGCAMNGNAEAFVIEGVPVGNDSHGIIDSCAINHCSVYGFRIFNIHLGFTISNCHMYESAISINDTVEYPVRFTNCFIDPKEFVLANNFMVVFNGNFFNNDYLGTGQVPVVSNSPILGVGNICKDQSWESIFNT
jgi:hypothetical protein